jgi:hypothetical protein
MVRPTSLGQRDDQNSSGGGLAGTAAATPLAHLANRPHGRYRLTCPVTFGYRVDEWAAQAVSGAVRYDLWCDPARGRWYADASWRQRARPVPPLRNCAGSGPWPSTSTPTIWTAGCSTRPVTPLPRPTPSRWRWRGLQQAPQTADCGRRSPRWSTSPRPPIAGASWSRTSTSLTHARPAGEPWVGALAASASGGWSRECQPDGFRKLLVGMAATPSWGWWRSTRRGPGCGARGIGRPRWINRQDLGHRVAASCGGAGDRQAWARVRARRRGWCAWRRPEDRPQRAADPAGQAMICYATSAAREVVPGPTVQGPDGPGGQRAGQRPTRPPLPERDAVRDQVAQDRSGPPLSTS